MFKNTKMSLVTAYHLCQEINIALSSGILGFYPEVVELDKYIGYVVIKNNETGKLMGVL